jgi:hypothetical protein
LGWTEPELKPVSGVAQVSVMGHGPPAWVRSGMKPSD